MTQAGIIWAICLLATAGVILRPFRLPEAIWAVAGAALLLACGLLPWSAGLRAVARGLDVYLFLTGMMLLSEAARREGVFDWLAAHAAIRAHGSSTRLFTLVFGIGMLVTIFMSNDATAVVLTPAVYAAARVGKARPLPLLFACAMIANAASFVLPISNPANLVLYDGHMPVLARWLASFALPSAGSIAATYIALRLACHRSLAEPCESVTAAPELGSGGRTALAGIGCTCIALLVVSAIGVKLGLPTAIAGGLTAAAVLVRDLAKPWELLRGVSWSVLPLVAGLFVLVAAVQSTGAIFWLAAVLQRWATSAPATVAAGAGAIVAFAGNLMNNLPAGLVASGVIAQAQPAPAITKAVLIGVDLGPNLSITGSLATILWLNAIRREGEDVSFWQFLKLGALVMPPALLLALAL